MLKLNIDADPHTGTRGARYESDAEDFTVEWEGLQVQARRLGDLAAQVELKVLVPRPDLTRFYINARWDYPDIPNEAEAQFTATMSPGSEVNPFGVVQHTWDPENPSDPVPEGELMTHMVAFDGSPQGFGLNLITPSLQPKGSNWSANATAGTKPIKIGLPQAEWFGVILAPKLTPNSVLTTLGQVKLTP